MNLPKIDCYYCGGAGKVSAEVVKVNLNEDHIYEGRKKRFMQGFTQTTDLFDNITLRCKCDNCKSTFASMIKLNIQFDTENMVGAATLSDLVYATPEQFGLVVDREEEEE